MGTRPGSARVRPRAVPPNPPHAVSTSSPASSEPRACSARAVLDDTTSPGPVEFTPLSPAAMSHFACPNGSALDSLASPRSRDGTPSRGVPTKYPQPQTIVQQAGLRPDAMMSPLQCRYIAPENTTN